MLKYFNCNFWRMLTGFLVILAVAIGLLLCLSFLENWEEAPEITNLAEIGETD